ncbi:hypothetical protein [Saccharopolyspora pogona]|uniref:hypothetical protein n=1 Tax=Saccharopolyspora pogona TaxID=333966 RepID=UPI001683B1F8|nr:hypothetical protein [Saccharopolyspora pogona]
MQDGVADAFAEVLTERLASFRLGSGLAPGNPARSRHRRPGSLPAYRPGVVAARVLMIGGGAVGTQAALLALGR